MSHATRNIDPDTSAGFGHEWSTFRQSESELSQIDREAIFHSYFHIFPWAELPQNSTGIDIGCGSGRWAEMVAPKVGHLHIVDPSAEALAVARQNLAKAENVSFHLASVDELPLPDASVDFAFSLGVLHHVPDTAAAISSVAAKLKSGAPLLIYLYYALENRPWWYRAIWHSTNLLRMVISRLPPKLRLVVSQVIALALYLPLARLARLVERLGGSPEKIPLAAYRNRGFYVMRTDAYDRFCTRLEKRFTRHQIEEMLAGAGFEGIRFSEEVPYWCAVGSKRQT
jgi:SAM-dependent methyltransferase